MGQAISQMQYDVLSLLRCALFAEPFQGKIADWDAIYQEASAQTVLPLVYSAAAPMLPQADKPKWERAVSAFLANGMRVHWEHVELHTYLSQADIAYVTMKGANSAFYYPDPTLRVMGDVDFLIDARDVERAKAVLTEAGFAEQQENYACERIYRRKGSVWELHWAVNGLPGGAAGERIQAYLSDVLASAVEVSTPDGSYKAPDAFHHGLILLLHTARHTLHSGVGLRHLCDWIVFANGFEDAAFRALFEAKLKAVGLWRFAQLLSQLGILYLGAPQKAWAMEAVDDGFLQKMLADVFAGGNFGTKDAQRLNQAKLMSDNITGTVEQSMIKQMLRTVHYKAKLAMPVCAKLPVLFPIGWAYVCIRHLFRIRSGKRAKLQLRHMVDGAAQRRELYQQFHLFEDGDGR